MKKTWIILTVLAVALIVITAVKLWPAGGPEPDSLYRRYERQEGVRVGFVKDFRIDDSTFVDVTTFEAMDSAGWEWMKSTLSLPEAMCGIDADTDSFNADMEFYYALVDRDNPGMLAADTAEAYVLFGSPLTRAYAVYHTDTEEKYDKLLRLAFDKYIPIENQ